MIAEKIIFFVGFLLIISVLLPVSATVNVISPGDVVFIGEENLDLSSFIQEPINIGIYGDGYGISRFENSDIPPDGEETWDIQEINAPKQFSLIPDIFIGKLGDWYSWDGENYGDLLFIVKEPSLKIYVWDNTANKEITNQEIPQGHLIDFIIETNMWSVSGRSGYTPEDAPISLVLTGPDGDVISSLNANDGETISLQNLPVDSKEWSWVYGKEEKASDKKQGWDTTTYEPGIYKVYAIADLNNIIDTYVAPDGSKYIGKTISGVKTLEIKGEQSINSKPVIVEEENPSSGKITIMSPTPTKRDCPQGAVCGTSHS